MQIAARSTALSSTPSAARLDAALKRAFDVIAAGLLLVCLSPVVALCALAVRLDSPGPVLFRQQRIGRGGRPFTMLKLRTMRSGADTSAHQAYAAAFVRGDRANLRTTTDGLFKMPVDPRITRTGRWLRQTSLDELPQLLNVLRGEMSLVGPRPPLPYEVELYRPEHLGRLAVRPGITGLWQVSGRSRTTFEEMVALDLDYIARGSLWLDLRILAATLPVVALGSGR